ncbi:MAG: hypothetical protein WC120_05165 [Parcubacteria group bacterium]
MELLFMIKFCPKNKSIKIEEDTCIVIAENEELAKERLTERMKYLRDGIEIVRLRSFSLTCLKPGVTFSSHNLK